MGCMRYFWNNFEFVSLLFGQLIELLLIGNALIWLSLLKHKLLRLFSLLLLWVNNLLSFWLKNELLRLFSDLLTLYCGFYSDGLAFMMVVWIYILKRKNIVLNWFWILLYLRFKSKHLIWHLNWQFYLLEWLRLLSIVWWNIYYVRLLFAVFNYCIWYMYICSLVIELPTE